MANLKGLTYEKQIRDMNFKLFSLGNKKGKDNLTHSQALLIKREMYIKDFAKYLEANNIEGKINQLLTESNLNSFLEERLSSLAISTAENYLSGFNSLIRAFNEVNLNNNVPQNYFQDKWKDIKASKNSTNKSSKRGLESDSIINKLYNCRYESGVIGQIMFQNGYRISEAINIVKNPQRYISKNDKGDYIISGVVGKGGKIYNPKILDNNLYINVKEAKNIPAKSTFHNDLKSIDKNLRAHDFRYSFAKNLYKKISLEISHEKALKIVSNELNHNRLEISLYYLSK